MNEPTTETTHHVCKACQAPFEVCPHLASDLRKLDDDRARREAARANEETRGELEATLSTDGGAYDKDDADRLTADALRQRYARIGRDALELVLTINAPFDSISGGGFRCPDPICQGHTAHVDGCRWARVVEAAKRCDADLARAAAASTQPKGAAHAG